MAGMTTDITKLSNQEIKDRAKVLGMSEAASVLSEQATTDEKLKVNDTPAVDSGKSDNNNSSQPVIEQSKVEEEKAQPAAEIPIEIVKGDTSEIVAGKLLKSGLISDKNTFVQELTNMGLTMEINIGNYKLKRGTDIKGIIKSITSSK